ncbi:MAG: nodulation protein NfeD, partial [Sedimenticola sp.]|nr:nodulation protein NfeD [Sedimenticola sp.]
MMNCLYARVWLLMLLPLLLPVLPAAADEPVPAGSLWMMKLDGVVGPSSADYLVRGIEQAGESGAAAVLLRIDTPGGLDSAMREMVSAVLAAPLPVICHVAPSGARAASAGTFLLYACHVAAMAPATNLGAATPVSIGTPIKPSPGDMAPSGDGQGDTEDAARPAPAQGAMERKITNDAVAYIRGLAELRGRNVEWAEQAVREGASLSASAALEQGVIDLVATDTESLLKALAGKKVQVGSREFTLDLASVPRITHDPDWRSEFLAVITNPNVAYVLMLIGLYGLIYEFANPGFGLPGILGLTCLLVALYAFQILPVSYAGLGLMLLGVG